ncbi:hypothetical protein ACFYSF_33980 [Streptomyces canus]|uniref:hypothetical protein n=1 Tax=Streptomyces canus TaxID=58343 RepID=UPI0036ADAAF0
MNSSDTTISTVSTESDGVPMLDLWHRGDTRQHALSTLHATQPNPSPGVHHATT